MENASEQVLETSAIGINPNLTPAGTWILLFLDSNQYEVFLKRKGDALIQKLTNPDNWTIRSGRKGSVWNYGFPRQESTALGVNYAFEFADILAFKTDYDPGAMLSSSTPGTKSRQR